MLINLSENYIYALWKHTYWPVSNNHISVLLSHNVQHLNNLLYWVMVDTSSKYKKEQWTVASCSITMYPSPLAKSTVTYMIYFLDSTKVPFITPPTRPPHLVPLSSKWLGDIGLTPGDWSGLLSRVATPGTTRSCLPPGGLLYWSPYP